MKNIKFRLSNNKRRGGIYFLTLASAFVLVSLVLALSLTFRLYRSTSRSNFHTDQAQIYAELGLSHISLARPLLLTGTDGDDGPFHLFLQMAEIY